MFAQLFASNGLSMDRLRALLEVGASGSIVKAAGGDPVRQSQYSRQIKELESFFQVRLVERQGKSIRLTNSGKELARISRFFMLGLSNFRRGCLEGQQIFRIGAGASFHQHVLLSVMAGGDERKDRAQYVIETVSDVDIERRLHELTLDFGVVTTEKLSRPLQLAEILHWKLALWVPNALHSSEATATRAFENRKLSLAWAAAEMPVSGYELPKGYVPKMICSSFVEAQLALETGRCAAILPDLPQFVADPGQFFRVEVAGLADKDYAYRLAWNPRLMRLNPHAARKKEALIQVLRDATRVTC